MAGAAQAGELRVATPAAWAGVALADPLALLNDHAHLEKKAALNALSLMHRWPLDKEGASHQRLAQQWVRHLGAVARDETDHLGRVLRLLERRGSAMSRGHRNPYAAALHRHVRTGKGPAEVVDLLHVSALIEARSCERFALLRAAATDRDLLGLYTALEASERGHHRVFLELAGAMLPPGEADQRWQAWLELEAAAIAAQPPGPTMHSGWSGARAS
ncbi:MAG: tRNA isopentenyl-2-thiomethyl-A-37 hydroxylase MiaE [Planctomycetia bacterium]